MLEILPGFLLHLHWHRRETRQRFPVGDCWHLFSVSVCFSESWSCRGRARPRTLPRRNRRQSLQWVRTLTCNHTVYRGSLIIVSRFSSPRLKISLLSYSILVSLLPSPSPSSPPSSSSSFSLGSSAGSADAGVCEENHRSGRIQDGWENTHTHNHTLRHYNRVRHWELFLVCNQQPKLGKNPSV